MTRPGIHACLGYVIAVWGKAQVRCNMYYDQLQVLCWLTWGCPISFIYLLGKHIGSLVHIQGPSIKPALLRYFCSLQMLQLWTLKLKARLKTHNPM